MSTRDATRSTANTTPDQPALRLASISLSAVRPLSDALSDFGAARDRVRILAASGAPVPDASGLATRKEPEVALLLLPQERVNSRAMPADRGQRSDRTPDRADNNACERAEG